FPVLTATVLFAACFAGATVGNRNDPPASAPMRLRVLSLSGLPHERGLAHGRAMKKEIHEIVQRWKAELAKVFKMDADKFIRRLLSETNFVAAIKKWTPDLWEEIRGIAEGSGIEFDTIFSLQLPDECFAHGETIIGEHCSSLGFSKTEGRPACIAQNMDTPTFADGFQLVLRIKHPDSDLESLVLTQAGCIGLNGVNNRAIGVCTNALWQLNGARDGLPVACVVRGILQQRTEGDAISFLRKVRHASGQNYLLGVRECAYSFECSASRVEQYKPDGCDDVVWHTNHPLANDDYASRHREALKESADVKPGSSEVRLHCLRERWHKTPAIWSLDLVKKTLS